MLGVERDADAGIDGQDELLVTLAPVLDHSDVAGRSRVLLTTHDGCSSSFPIAAVPCPRSIKAVVWEKGEIERM